MIQSEQLANNIADWIITGLLVFWGFLISLLSSPDWVKVLTIALLLTKIAHEAFRFFQSWRRSRLKRRAVDRKTK